MRHRSQAIRNAVTAPACVAMLIGLVAFVAPAQALTKFGSDLRNSDGSLVRPNFNHSCQRSSPGLTGSQRCTRIAVRFTETGSAQGNRKAPRDGVIKRIDLISQARGNFVLELARVKNFNGGDNGRAKIVHKGATIDYEADPFHIQSFHVHQRIEKGDYLAITSSHAGMLLCEVEQTQQLLFQPVLKLGDRFKSNKGHTSGCTLLLRAVYAKGS